MIQALIFDFDGLVLDTEMPIYLAWRECYEDHGHDLDLKVYTQCVGTDNVHYDPARELEALVGRALHWPTLDEARRKRVREMLDTHDTLPGVRELLREAKDAGIPCSIASSSTSAWVGPWIERLGLSSYFEHLITVDLVSRPKPSPELFNLAAKRLGAQPERALIFEDSLNGLRAAHAANISCVVVPNQVTSHLDFEGALRKIASLEEANLESLREWLATKDTAAS